MECRQGNEKLMLYLEGELKDSIFEFEKHLKDCPSCGQELEELKEAVKLFKNKEIFCPENAHLIEFARGEIKDESIKEHINKCQMCHKIYEILKAQMIDVPEAIESNQVIMPDKIKNTVSYNYPALKKEKKQSTFLLPLKAVYAFALVICIVMGAYFINDYINAGNLSGTKVGEKISISSRQEIKTGKDKDSFKGKKEASQKVKYAKPEKKNRHPETSAVYKKDLKIDLKPTTGREKETRALEGKQAAVQPEGTEKNMQLKKDIVPSKKAEMDLKDKPEIYIEEKAKNILAEYPDIKIKIKQENSIITIQLFCPKNTNMEIIEEIKKKLIKELDLKKDKDKIITIFE